MADQQYKPTGEQYNYPPASQETDWQTEHGGLKQDGTPDKRVGTGGMSSRSLQVRNHEC
jgi:hypothetical protein